MAILKVSSYKDLEVWNKGIEIVDHVYELPKEESYGLAAHMQKSAISVPSNIAEGHARQHTREYQQFCHIALGSCAELVTQLTIAKRRSYVSEEDFSRLEDELDHETRMLQNLIGGLKNRLNMESQS